MATETEDSKKIALLEAQVANLTSERDTLKADNEKKAIELTTAQGIVTDLKEKLASKQDAADALPTLKIGKDTYELTSEFFYKDQDITIELLKENSKLAEELVKEGVGNLRKVVTKA